MVCSCRRMQRVERSRHQSSGFRVARAAGQTYSLGGVSVCVPHRTGSFRRPLRFAGRPGHGRDAVPAGVRRLGRSMVAHIAEAAGIKIGIQGPDETGITTAEAHQAAVMVVGLNAGNQYMNPVLGRDMILCPDLTLDQGRLPISPDRDPVSRLNGMPLQEPTRRTMDSTDRNPMNGQSLPAQQPGYPGTPLPARQGSTADTPSGINCRESALPGKEGSSGLPGPIRIQGMSASA